MNRGDILKISMAQEHVNVRELANKLGTHEVFVNRHLSGFRKIDDDLFKKFADAIKEIGEEHRKEFEAEKKQKRSRTMAIDEIIKTLELAKAEVEWNYPLDYFVAIDQAVELLQALKENEDDLK